MNNNAKSWTNDLSTLVERYAEQLMDSMDMKTMECFVFDTLVENLTNYTEEELITEISDHYPELLEEWRSDNWHKGSCVLMRSLPYWHCSTPEPTMSVYTDNGYANRKEYLKELADEYGKDLVYTLTSVLPASEDFDGLLIALEDAMDGF